MIEELGESGLEIILYLHKVREAALDRIRRDLHKGYSAVYRALHVLDKHKLITERAEGNKRIFKLTKKGELLATKLREAEEIILKELPEGP